MAQQAPLAGAQASDTPRRAVRLIASRLSGQRELLARQVVERSRQEIVDYRSPSDPRLLDELLGAAMAHIDALVVSMQTGDAVPDEYLRQIRQIAARRVHQGVALEGFLHATRLWTFVCWYAVLGVARIDAPSEREAALEIATTVMTFGDRIMTVATHAYLDEVTDRGLLRRDLLDALLTSKGDDSQSVRLARRLRLKLEESYVVVVVRGEGIEVEQAREQPPAAQSRLDRLVEQTRLQVRPSAGTPLTGMRNGDLVVLYPADGPEQLDAVKQDCERLATAISTGVSIGISGWQRGRAALGAGYAQAKEAATIAERLGISQRAVGLDEVLVDQMLSASAPARGILETVLGPLLAYDAARQAVLVPTLRAYLAARFNLTKAAETLYVNPNTVVYRLGRIKALTGRDTHDLDDVVVLYLALKLDDSV
ncbi:MAG TPA: helix-turn-helix domain-containing protein [Solirubrobacteraceae bacterium]